MKAASAWLSGTLLLAGCGGAPPPPQSAPAPTTMPAAAAPAQPPTLYRYSQRGGGFSPFAPGSTNIHIAVNKEKGFSEIGGLKFTEPLTVNVWEDGTFEVDKEGVSIEATDGAKYISKKMKVGEKEGIVLVRQ